MHVDYVTAHLGHEDRVMAVVWDSVDGEPEVGLTLGFLALTLDLTQARSLHNYLDACIGKLDAKGYMPPGATPPEPEDVPREEELDA